MTTEKCPNRVIFEKLESSFDRLREAEWTIDLMKMHYHSADSFRWSLNCFLRSLKEVAQIILMEIQDNPDARSLFKTIKTNLNDDELISFLFKQRDIIVHKQMLKPNSSAFVGFTKGRGLKLGFKFPLNPLEDSEIGIKKYIHFLIKSKEKDFFGFLYMDPDDDCGEYSCVQREWKLEEFPDTEIIDLATHAWEIVAEALFETARFLGAKLIQPKLEKTPKDDYQIEAYHPQWVKEQYDDLASRMQ